MYKALDGDFMLQLTREYVIKLLQNSVDNTPKIMQFHLTVFLWDSTLSLLPMCSLSLVRSLSLSHPSVFASHVFSPLFLSLPARPLFPTPMHTHSLLFSLTHSLTELVLGPFAFVFPTRMGQAPRFVIVGFAEHEPVFTTDWEHLLPMKIWSKITGPRLVSPLFFTRQRDMGRKRERERNRRQRGGCILPLKQ